MTAVQDFNMNMCISNLVGALTYVGTIDDISKESKDLKFSKKKGDIVIESSTNMIYCYTGDEWIDIGYPSEEEEKAVKMKPIICERCGGSFKGDKCWWCDTEYSRY